MPTVNGPIQRLRRMIARIVATEMRELRATNYFCLRLFVSLEVALFYFVGVVYAAVLAPPETRFVYAFFCGVAGLAAVLIFRWAWTVGAKARNFGG